MSVSDKANTLRAQDHGHPPVVCYGISAYESNSMKSSNPHSGIYEAETSRTLDLNGGNPACNQGGIMVVEQKVTGSLCAAGYSKLGLQEAANGMYITQCSWDGAQVSPTLTANNASGCQRMPDKENFNAVIDKAEPPKKYKIRRLTPTECARLQGFPDWWVDGAEGSDSAIYKMWGNGIALPCAADVIGRLAKELDK